MSNVILIVSLYNISKTVLGWNKEINKTLDRVELIFKGEGNNANGSTSLPKDAIT